MFLPTQWKLIHQHHVQAGKAEWRAGSTLQGSDMELHTSLVKIQSHDHTHLKGRQGSRVSSLWLCVPLKLWERHLLLIGKRDEPCFLFTSPHPILPLNISHQPGFHSSLLPAKRPPNSFCATLHGYIISSGCHNKTPQPR